ncbi:MAG: DNA polymerase III subunit delta [Clostridium sp.]|jgi:DNA polymerase-3 subunit delta|nr:DNA polymerase III subunit delta [Clostridium sp.]
MRRIQEDIKSGEFRQIYLLYGEERYLRRQYRDRLGRALCEGLDPMNIHVYEGKNISVGEIVDLAETVPFFSPRRVLLLDDSGLFKSGGEKMAEYLAQVPETAFFLFLESEVDKRGKLFKTVQAKGCAAEFVPQEEAVLKRWIAQRLKKEGKSGTESTIRLFLEKTGTDMEHISMELEKLVCYCLEAQEITERDVEAVCTARISSRIFDMVGAIAEKQPQKALRLYDDLLARKEPPLRILFLIARQCNLLLQVKEMKAKGYDNRTIGAKIGLPPFIAGKCVSQAARFPADELKRAVVRCVEAEEDVKTGKMNDQLGVEMLLLSVLSS